ncbi:MAG: GGDEF domain-containing protein [Oscillospiraceae bacterium]
MEKIQKVAEIESTVEKNPKEQFRNLISKYYGDDLPIQVRFFNIVFCLGFFAELMGVGACLMLGSSVYAISIAGTFAIFMPAMFFFANYSKTYHTQIMVASLVFLDFIILPLMYLTGGGIDCGIPSYFVMGIALTMFLIKGRLGIILAVIDSVWYLLVITFSYYYPNFVVELPNEQSVFMAISSNAVMAAISVAFIARGIFRQFNNEKIAVSKLTRDLRDMSVKDPLTTTYNRRFMFEFLQNEMSKSWELNTPLSIIMLDIDKFKRLNDNYGHLVGDEVLINLSLILKTKCRNDDIVSRYGGEEFLMIYPGVDNEIAIKRAEEIRAAVEEASLSKDVLEDVTVSIGVATYKKGMTNVKFIDEADKFLYKAKEAGRNKVCYD